MRQLARGALLWARSPQRGTSKMRQPAQGAFVLAPSLTRGKPHATTSRGERRAEASKETCWCPWAGCRGGCREVRNLPGPGARNPRARSLGMCRLKIPKKQAEVSSGRVRGELGSSRAGRAVFGVRRRGLRCAVALVGLFLGFSEHLRQSFSRRVDDKAAGQRDSAENPRRDRWLLRLAGRLAVGVRW